MSQEVANDRDVDSSLEQGDRTTVTHDVRGDPPEIRPNERGTPDIFAKHVCDTIASEWCATGVSENRFASGTGANNPPQGRSRFAPQRAIALLAPLAIEPDLRGTIQSECARMDSQGFTHPSARIVEKEQECS